MAESGSSQELRIPYNIPQEIRGQIAGEVCAPQFFCPSDFDGLHVYWLPNIGRALTLTARIEGISAWYTSKELIIELPEFIPGSSDGTLWPSEIYIHDATNELSFRCAPPFLSRQFSTVSNPRYLDLDDFEKCPFWFFSRISIRIPPPSGDPASLIMNWNRLKYIGHALHRSWNLWRQRTVHPRYFREFSYPDTPLPIINIHFLEHPSRGWVDSQGELCHSLDTKGQFLSDGCDRDLPDAVFLLRALAPIRGACGVNIRLPFRLPTSEEGRHFSFDWFSNMEAQRYRFGEYMEPGNWTDRESIEWLQRCELVLHQTLYMLDSELAPYLRLEQMAHLEHKAIARLFEHAYRYGKEVYSMAHKCLSSLILCHYTYSPQTGCECSECEGLGRVPWPRFVSWPLLGSWNINRSRILISENMTDDEAPLLERFEMGSWIAYWTRTRALWLREFKEIHDELQSAIASGKPTTSDQMREFRSFVTMGNNSDSYGFELDQSSLNTAELYYNATNAPQDYYSTMGMVLDPDYKYSVLSWLREWPSGIARNEAKKHDCARARWFKRVLSEVSN